jgi:hypothetical protein
MPALPFEQKRRETTAKLAALMLANAFIFQEQLSALRTSVRPIRSVLGDRDFVGRTIGHWEMIINEINYVPIFKVARDILRSLPASSDADNAIRHLAGRALEIVSKKAALRHDLMGRIYHLLLLEAKYLGTYYTSVPAATLLLKLALDIDRWPKVNWSDSDELRSFQIGDLACGTGTLLMAASQALTDNFIKWELSKGGSVDASTLRDLHKLIIEEMLHGYDVLPSAVHLTASTLALLAPETCFEKMRLYSLPLGKAKAGQVYLGSIDYISANTIQTQLDLMIQGDGDVARTSDESESVAPLPNLDLCVMNPPFVRSVGGNLLFGSIPDQRGQMQKELARRIRVYDLKASSTAGLGSVFAAIGERHVKAGGRLALVLPAAVTTGIAWGKTRDLINHGYILETVVASHDPGRWNFSENTDLSEVLLIARKRDEASDNSAVVYATQFINLWSNPTSSAHALAIAEQISKGAPAPLGSVSKPRHGIAELVVGTRKYGETLEIPWTDVKVGLWLGCAFAQTNLVRTAWMLRNGYFYRAEDIRVRQIPMRRLGDIAVLGPDRRDIADGFTVSSGRTRYPAFMGHSSEAVRTIQTTPNKWLSPRAKAAAGRSLRDVGLLWSRAGSIMIAERSWLNTQRSFAVRLDVDALSNVWWPVRLRRENELAEKVLVLWLNSTLGLLTTIAHRIPTRGAWIQFKKPTIENLPVLDVTSLPKGQLRQLAGVYDAVANMGLSKFTNMANDPIRSDIDHAFAQVLNLPPLNDVRAELAEEPIIKLRPCIEEDVPLVPEDQLEFELL